MECVAIDEYKNYVKNHYHPEHYGLYPKAGKYFGWQKTVVYLHWIRTQYIFYSDLKQIYYIKIFPTTGSHSLIIDLSNDVVFLIYFIVNKQIYWSLKRPSSIQHTGAK